ncbi:unnamed protein product [Darwinula stevensoni]|uniref:Uncharacterized protein n=1 Tax=Darwinula stevensoni TaxID=69355 RepID=A0A7R8XIB7_9CRUS|nr:unnamed protein product [Darwinula stevensoni]CAG0894177.1 unnamed protein product [Darwinula stevensoni]
MRPTADKGCTHLAHDRCRDKFDEWLIDRMSEKFPRIQDQMMTQYDRDVMEMEAKKERSIWVVLTRWLRRFLSYFAFRASNKDRPSSLYAKFNEEFHRVTTNAIRSENCGCPRVLTSVYMDLQYHWLCGGSLGKAAYFLFNTAMTQLYRGTPLVAQEQIERGISILNRAESMNADRSREDHFVSHFSKFLWMRAHVLLGQTKFALGFMAEAKEQFLEALDIIGYPIPMDDEQCMKELVRQASIQRHHRGNPQKYIAREDSIIYQEASTTLSYLASIASYERQPLAMHLYALTGLNFAEVADCCFCGLMLSYCDIMEVLLLKHDISEVDAYEAKAMETLGVLERFPLEVQPIIAHFAGIVNTNRLGAGRINLAVDAGIGALNIATRIKDPMLVCAAFPTLSQALLTAFEIPMLSDVLKQFQIASMAIDDLAFKILYYLTAFDVILDAGIPMENYVICESMFQRFLSDPAYLEQNSNHYPLLASLALWHCRCKHRELANHFFTSSQMRKPPHMNDFYLISASLKLLECRLISMNDMLKVRKYEHFLSVIPQVQSEFQEIKGYLKRFAIFKPRLLLLSAYLTRIRGQISASDALLIKCRNAALKQGNRLEAMKVYYLKRVWSHEVGTVEANRWLEMSHLSPVEWKKRNENSWTFYFYPYPIPY